MAETEEFQKWVRIEASRRSGELERIRQKVEREIKKVKVEVHDEKGIWIEWKEENEDNTNQG